MSITCWTRSRSTAAAYTLRPRIPSKAQRPRGPRQALIDGFVIPFRCCETLDGRESCVTTCRSLGRQSTHSIEGDADGERTFGSGTVHVSDERQGEVSAETHGEKDATHSSRKFLLPRRSVGTWASWPALLGRVQAVAQKLTLVDDQLTHCSSDLLRAQERKLAH